QMYRGGIFDHIGGGFSRYSTDNKWLVPHFEKMLYDNALLALAYGETYQATGKPFYARVVKEIFSYVLRDMTSPKGAFYTAEDADSEGEEGKFYVWTLEEVQKILGPRAEAFCRDYDITLRGNFEGKNIPNLIATGITKGQEEARKQLFSVREKRTCPFRDDKILTGWNGLMIAALAFNARVLGEPEYALAAEKATHFLLDNLRREDGRLLARYRDGEKAGLALAEDYAFFIWGLLELFQATSRAHFLSKALELNSDLIRYFWDEVKGGLYQYGNDGESLIARPKEAHDGALPSSNSVAPLNFLRLGHLTGNRDLEEKALQQFTAFGGQINSYPQGFTFFLTAIYWYQAPTLEIQVIGENAKDMLRLINSMFLPEALLVTMDPTQDQGLERLIPSLEGRHAINDSTTAYVCRGTACQTPTTDLDTLRELLTQ
ncbi:MAG TPA: thioredoxin domain-containing protein, partial [Clostridia bacterium]|nr:thioredoxin domain-containing protein [Clostridia bacterium]